MLHVGCTQCASRGLESHLVAAVHITEHPLAASALNGIHILASAGVVGVNGNKNHVAIYPLVLVIVGVITGEIVGDEILHGDYAAVIGRWRCAIEDIVVESRHVATCHFAISIHVAS